MGKLSELIANLNERSGVDQLAEAVKILFVQHKQAIKDSDELRVAALNNDRDQYRGRHGAQGR